jgi:hypothetical protein
MSGPTNSSIGSGQKVGLLSALLKKKIEPKKVLSAN